MKLHTWGRVSAGVAAVLLLWGGSVLAQESQPGTANQAPGKCDNGAAAQGGVKTPEKIQGQVTSIQPDQGKLTMRDADGTVREFRVPKEVLQQYKVGDHIQATLRVPANCKPNA